MTTEEQARKNLTQQRQQDDRIHDTMLNRAEAELHTTSEAEAIAEARARETLTEQRQHEDHIKETMLHRSEEELGHNG